ncbi:S-adenosyl-L-methionine-dependent methyltransferase [Ilyonectria robusta]|uniref:S-adenosyl-L-methionine-dependent methyltransferase n=1 Tax=Ilyonectria robusta TaxID=1079257 RepID=UPI001E8D5AF0|nr:S-adenosyl-L-methionine-dependent methyltransferase [Ilyonectria robusta]KAH8669209.1 S-adenosyl-L-methionine-dependent methyltransferase [Ilyonectria robusta]
MPGSSGSAVDISIVTTPNNINAVSSLLDELRKGHEALPAKGDEGRKDLLLLARTLVQSLETPRETMAKHCWAQTAAFSALIFGVEVKLWKRMAGNGDRPQSVHELAENLRVDPLLLGRMMRHLGAMGYITETGNDEYKPTKYSKALSLDIIGNGYLATLSSTSAAMIRFHEFASRRGFENPDDASDTSLMMAYDTKLDVFGWLQALGRGSHFNDHMAGYRQGRTPWMDSSIYPVQSRLVDGADTSVDAPFLVDIGGNRGHDLQEFQRYHPDTPGRLYLQDVEAVISSIESLSSSITPMCYDFHTEQPIKGARAYYIHSCLHNWPDSVCKSILSRVSAAMKPGYSRLLINEYVIPATGAHWEATSLDLMMMSLMSSKERTEDDWRGLIEAVGGLEIVRFWHGANGVESVIECKLVEKESRA